MRAELVNPLPVEQEVVLTLTKSEADRLKILVGRYKYTHMQETYTAKLYAEMQEFNGRLYTTLTDVLGYRYESE